MLCTVFLLLVCDVIVGLNLPTSAQTSPGTVPAAVIPVPVPVAPPPPPTPGIMPAEVPVPFVINVNAPTPLLPITGGVVTPPQPVGSAPVASPPPSPPVPAGTGVVGGITPPVTTSAGSQVYSKLAFVFTQTYGNATTLAIGEIRFFDRAGNEIHPISATLRAGGSGVTNPNTLIDKSTQSSFIVDGWKPRTEVEIEFYPPQTIDFYEVITPATNDVSFDTYPSAWNLFRYDGPNAIPVSPAAGVTNSRTPNSKLNPPTGRFNVLLQPPPSPPPSALVGDAKADDAMDSEMMAVILVVIAMVVLVAVLFAVFVRLKSEYTVPVIARGGGYPPDPSMAQYVVPGTAAPVAPPAPPPYATKALSSRSPMGMGGGGYSRSPARSLGFTQRSSPPPPVEMMMVQPTWGR